MQDVNEYILGVGSNIDPERNIARMLRLLGERVTLMQISDWVRTTPLGITDQPDFVNGAVKITTPLNKSELVRMLKCLENTLGRDRSVPRFGPRVIDLDIVVWNGVVIDENYHKWDFLRVAVDQIR